MTGLNFDDLRWLHLLWVVLALAAVGVIGIWRSKVALRRFADAGLISRLAPRIGWTRPLARLLLVTAAMAFLVAALIGPRWGEATQALIRRNIDVIVLLDVSRSMLAEDLAPNRLERAKLAIRDDLLPALGGDRIGLITFAGVPSPACPLTTDYGFFRLALDDVTIRSAPRGGTLIGDAIRRASRMFDDKLDTHRIVILITDGEDHNSFPEQAAAGLWEDQQAPVIALALGDPEVGARIPVRPQADEYIEYAGEVVRSKADFTKLQDVADASPTGIFVPVGTSNFDLGDIYTKVARAMRFEEQSEQRAVQQPSRYHPFAITALLLVLIESFTRESSRRLAPVAGPRRPAQQEAA